jgi:hypothetical protein
VRFGNALYFTFVDPNGDPSALPDYDKALQEASDAEVKSMLGSQEEEFRRKEAEMKA